MKLPKWLWVPILILIILGCVGLILSLFCRYHILSNIADFALVLTLAAVLAYVYYTYLIAKDAWMPSASFALKAYSNDRYHFAFIIQNHSKVSLNCWCNLNPTIDGQAVSLGGFYSGQSSFDLQPFGVGNGHFDIRDFLDKAGRNLEEMKKMTDTNNVKRQLKLDIEFWYKPVGSVIEIRNPRQPHYFDFNRDVMVTDF
jgi:hypothetical protein